jgi:hypothetical protein
MDTFWTAFKRAIGTEPFVDRRLRAPERVNNLAASILYNNDERKVLSQNPILYIHAPGCRKNDCRGAVSFNASCRPTSSA